MKKYFYHVVTGKAMKLSQEIVFDDVHHSDMYKRVYNFEKVVRDIYDNPDKYKDNEFDHHTKVALREFALEEVRKKKFPNYPSRLASLYVSKTLEEAEGWYNSFVRLGRPTYQIVKVEVDGNVFTGDACNCFDGTINKQYNLEKSEIYWTAKDNQNGEKPVYETIVDGKIKVVEIVKINENMFSNEKNI